MTPLTPVPYVVLSACALTHLIHRKHHDDHRQKEGYDGRKNIRSCNVSRHRRRLELLDADDRSG